MDHDPDSQPGRPATRQSGEIITGRRPGDRHLRVARRPQSQRIQVPALASRRRVRHPALVFVYGFAALILAGAVVLTLPISSAEGQWTPLLDALFTATSAVCVTGLVVVDTGTYWSGFGQAIILVLIQLGGFGFMTSSTLLWLVLGHRVTLRQRLLLREALGGGSLGSIPSLVRKVIVFALIAEAVGATILTTRFLMEMEVQQALWWGVFHAVSAFNNAGFDIIGGYRSLVPYSHDPVVLLTVAALFMAGGISYTVVDDLAKSRRFERLTLDTKLVLVSTGILLVLGTLGLLFTEWTNADTLGAMDAGPRTLNAFFQAATPRTAGFNSVDIGQMTEAGLLVIIALMFIGGASGSTAGGIKLQTFSLLLFAITSTIRGLDEVQAFRRQVAIPQVLRALAVALLSVALAFAASFALNVTEGVVFIRVLFEAVSAFGTVGLSTGITPDSTHEGRAILILIMFTGRLGPLTLALALAAREHRTHYRWPEDSVKIG
jgi:trk system potassium uptake protein TrkH